MTRLHGWAPRGERLVGKVPQGHWKTGPDVGCDCRKPAPRLIRNATNGRIDKTIKRFYKQKPRSKSISGNLPTRQSSEQATATAKHPPAPESSLGRFQALEPRLIVASWRSVILIPLSLSGPSRSTTRRITASETTSPRVSRSRQHSIEPRIARTTPFLELGSGTRLSTSALRKQSEALSEYGWRSRWD